MEAIKKPPSPYHYVANEETVLSAPKASELEIEECSQSTKPIMHRAVECLSKDVLDCEEHKKIVLTLIEKQIPMFDVDDDSIANMAEALKFAGIDTIECAKKMNLQIIPPGPVFHTWYAYKGTTLFDGTNNDKKYDYVKQLNDQALRLAEWDIPMILVYTNNSMSDEQVKRMDSLFKDHPNIIILNIERDLSDLPLSNRFLVQEKGNILYLDGIRCEVLMDFQRILSKAKLQADNQGKNDVSRRLDKWKNKSITYMDMDNYFLRRPFFQIAPNGFLKTYHFSFHFKLGCIEEWANNAGKDFPDGLVESAKKQASLLEFTHVEGETPSVDDIKAKADELYEFVRSGEAEKIWHWARKYFNLKCMNSSWPKLLVPWGRDRNLFIAKSGFEENIPEDSERYGPASENDLNPIYDLESPTMPPEEFTEKAVRLGGLQQIKSIYIGMHNSYL